MLGGRTLESKTFQKQISLGVDFYGADLSLTDLSESNLAHADFSHVSLNGAQLTRAVLHEALFLNTDLANANLSETNLRRASLAGNRISGANFSNADLRGAGLINSDLSGSNLNGADLTGADLSYANLSESTLTGANFSRAGLINTIFERSTVGGTVFGQVYLGKAKGLESIRHLFPSILGIETLYISEGNIPELFLRGCGVPEDFIRYLPSLIGAEQVVQFYSCFISYSSQNEEFAERLHSRMQASNLRVWFAPEDIKGGQKMIDQIDTAIRAYDKLLLVLSEESMKSKWVVNEIKRARIAEEKEGRRKLFPIRLVDYNQIEKWEEMTSTGEDVAEEIRKYYIPDFSNWKDHDSFEKSFTRLLKDLKAEERKTFEK